ncbi:MAG: flagellar biosynthesis anti-sigma factor FlgM [Negativicutes bacterium]
MIISGNSGINSVNKVYRADSVRSGKSISNTAGSGSSRSDEVVLSSEAQGMQQQIAAIKALPDVRQDRVNELTLKIESGQYQVDAAKIADQMIGRALADKLK